MDENVLKFNKTLLNKVAEQLKKNGFEDVHLFDTRQQAREKILELIPPNTKVGLGGSVTITELGLLDELQNRNILIRHTKNMTLDERKKTWREAFSCDFYLASPQAITYDGRMFFIDKYGNRLAAVVFGPGKVILVSGFNKIVQDLDTALWRIKNVAAVMNANRLNLNTPCVASGKCMDCQTQERICNVISFLLKKPPATDYSIILVNEQLGY